MGREDGYGVHTTSLHSHLGGYKYTVICNRGHIGLSSEALDYNESALKTPLK